jgi:NAD(P)-dependent dehydrogenase (short-subunit alcohol dehydrogenase family)
MAIALVTGTSTGIGLATAVTLGRGGHKVIATMRNLDGATELQKIVSEEKLLVTIAALNVDDDASVDGAISKVLSEHGRIDVLVNNAGVGDGGSVEEGIDSQVPRSHGDQFFRRAALYQSGDTGYARTSAGLHCQHNVDFWPNGPRSVGSLLRV